jgi:hypothetical protein
MVYYIVQKHPTSNMNTNSKGQPTIIVKIAKRTKYTISLNSVGLCCVGGRYENIFVYLSHFIVFCMEY